MHVSQSGSLVCVWIHFLFIANKQVRIQEGYSNTNNHLSTFVSQTYILISHNHTDFHYSGTWQSWDILGSS